MGWGTHLRKHQNIHQTATIRKTFNLSLIMRQMQGAGTPREWKNRGGILFVFVYFLLTPRGSESACEAEMDVSREILSRTTSQYSTGTAQNQLLAQAAKDLEILRDAPGLVLSVVPAATHERPTGIGCYRRMRLCSCRAGHFLSPQPA